MKKVSRTVFLALGLSLPVFNAGAAITVTNSSPIFWPNTSTVSTNCSLILPTLQPLSQPKTLIVDNNLPVGSVLYSWGYDEFIPEIHSACLWASNITVNSANSSHYASIMLLMMGFNGDMLLPTSNSGVALKLYYTFTAKGSGNSASPYYQTTELWPSNYGYVVGVESPMIHPTPLYLSNFMPVTNNTSSPYTIFFDGSANYSKLSFRGELIKTQQVPESTALQLTSAGNLFSYYFYNANNNPVGSGFISGSDVLGGGGINIVHPTCQLRGSTDYQVNLGSWESSSSLPAYSESKPLDINIECSGKLNNVEFSFQDTGSGSLSNRNISVYDSVGGQQINGLEIEMSYAGSRIDIHKISESPTSYKINTGSHGSVKTNPTDTSFNSQSQAQFGARFVQNAAITRGGSSYTGPVTGQVNMFITYN